MSFLVSSRFGPASLLRLLTSSAAFVVASASALVAQVADHGFESGATHGWGPRGSAVVTSSTEAARTGTSSLKTTGRTAGWNGPAVDLRGQLSAGTAYQISGWVRLVAGQPASNLKFTIEARATGSATSDYTQVNNALPVTDGGWVQLQGTFTPSAPSYDVLTLYLESDDPTSEYYLDDFTIAGPEAPPDTSGLFTDFETGTAEGWMPRGPVTLTPTTEAAANGAYSLKVTGREATWQGPAIDVFGKIFKGSQYAIGVRVRLVSGEAPTQVRVSLEVVNNGSTSWHTIVGNTDVTDGAWVDLSTLYTFGLDASELRLYVETANGNQSFYIDDFILDYIEPPTVQDLPPVHEVLAPYFDVGAAVSVAELSGAHAELLLRHFNTIVAGNEMKWSSLQPTEGVFNWGPADAIANFARAHGLKLRGHTLIWHSQVSAWVFQDASGNPLQPGNPAHRQLVIDRMRTHIHAVVSRYADVVTDWDVVNEVIDPSGPGGLRDSPWLRLVGPEFIDLAFQFADELLQGSASLFINDYNTNEPAKLAALKNVVEGLLARGVRVDGVGHQTHISIVWPPLSEIATSIDTFTALGLDNQITELDLSVYTNDSDTSPPTAEALLQQAYRYRDLFNLFRAKSSQISSVVFWGTSDDTSWLKTFPVVRDNKPLLFDERLQAKLAYWAVVDPSELPIQPKSLNVTQYPATGKFNKLDDWAAIAPTPLDPGSDAPSLGEFRAMWSLGAVHIAVEVFDQTHMRGGDSVEIFLGNHAPYTFNKMGMQRIGGAEGPTTPTPRGYATIITIPLSGALAIGQTLAFDVRVTDAATNRRQSWSNTRQNQESDTSAHGTLRLLPEKLVAEIKRGAPTIDGIADKIWKNATEISTTRFPVGSNGATAKVKLLWDSGYLYLYATVTDPLLSKASPNPWEEDSVEIFVDPNNGQTTTYEAGDGQFRINFDNEVSFGGSAVAGNLVSATQIVPGGYVVEAAIRIDASETVKGSVLGFDFQVNNDPGTASRTSVATWNDLSGNAYQDTSQFGALILR